MSNAFAAAAATLFADPNLSVAATYVSATGVSTPLRLIYAPAANTVLGAGAMMGTISPSDSAEFLQSDVPVRPVRGAMVYLETGEQFQIRSSAEPAKRGLTWRVVLTDG